jgi:GTPase SAR1 family protein
MKTVGFFFLVFDVSRRNSLQELISIRERLIAGKTETPWMLLIANKADLEETREVKREEAEELAASWNSKYIEVSVKNGNNINQCFLEVIREALKITKIQPARSVKTHKCCILM